MSGTLTGVGVGPGAPDLITVRARDVLAAADVVVVPVSTTSVADEPGYAERVVRTHLPADAPLERMVFELDEDRRAAAWRDAAVTVAAHLSAGRDVAFATIGDPNVYSTFTYLARAVRERAPGVTVATVPGITAMQELAARSSTVLVEHEEPLTLLPMTAGLDRLRAALDDGGTLVLYKGGRQLPEIRAVVAAAGRDGGAVFGTRLGLPDEDVRTALPDDPQAYLSTVLVPAHREESP